MTFMSKKEFYETFATFPRKKITVCQKRNFTKYLQLFRTKKSQGTKNFTNSKSIYEGKGDSPSCLAATPLSFDSEFCLSACLSSSRHHKPVNLSINCRVFQCF